MEEKESTYVYEIHNNKYKIVLFKINKKTIMLVYFFNKNY